MCQKLGAASSEVLFPAQTSTQAGTESSQLSQFCRECEAATSQLWLQCKRRQKWSQSSSGKLDKKVHSQSKWPAAPSPTSSPLGTDLDLDGPVARWQPCSARGFPEPCKCWPSAYSLKNHTNHRAESPAVRWGRFPSKKGKTHTERPCHQSLAAGTGRPTTQLVQFPANT